MKVICTKKSLLPERLKNNCHYFSLYSSSGREFVGRVATGWHRQLQRLGFSPEKNVWDFVTIGLSVAAADISCLRENSPDGWTREIELVINLNEPELWNTHKSELEKAFKFLTGDFWSFTFLPDGVVPPSTTTPISIEADCVSLLSGGMDSLIGGIDLIKDGKNPCFVSQTAKGDKQKQIEFTQQLNSNIDHYQWKNPISLSNKNREGSTRGRSIVFLAYSTLVASGLQNYNREKIDLYVPENGFISLNTSLNAGRMGSYSTKTTHPVFLNTIQNIMDQAGINVNLVSPYQFKTKGVMLLKCKDPLLMKSLIFDSTSCGKYNRYARQHCGKCVPCLVRRAAFYKAELEDETNSYVYKNLVDARRSRGPNDIGAVAMAYLKYKNLGIESIIGGSLSFSSINERKKYVKVVEEGLKELGEYLESEGIA